MSALKKKRGRVLYINMDEIHVPQYTFLNANKAAWKKRQEMKSLDPFGRYSTKPLKFDTPEKLQDAVNSYFDSCYGPWYYKGVPMLDERGKPIIVQTKPFTVSGLARHLHINTATLKDYECHSKSGLIPTEYADIILDAKLRIQEYAEGRLYDRDGSNGARFVLEAGFGWMTRREKSELKQSKKRIKLAQEKLKLIQDANKLEDRQLTVNILRADIGEDNDDKQDC